MVDSPVTELYQRLKEQAEKQEKDYQGLDQGEASTLSRYRQVVALLGPYLKDCSLLDIGCGTGLMLQYLREQELKPQSYHGTDILDRRPILAARLHTFTKLRWTFELVPEGPPVLGGWYYDIAVCLGISGYWGMHTYRHCRELVNSMIKVSEHGLVIFPMYFDAHKMGEEWLTRFDPDDMLEFLGKIDITVIRRTWEFIVLW